MEWLEIDNVGMDGSDRAIGEICYIIDGVVKINEKYELVQMETSYLESKCVR